MTPRAIRVSPTLATNERVRELIAAGRPIVHLAFGEAGLPVHPVLREMLDAAGTRNTYPPVAGTHAARAAAAGYFGRRGIPTDPDSIILAPGSKPMLYALLIALEGVLLLPKPSWVSYAAQAQLTSKEVVHIPIPDSAGGVPDPGLLLEWATRNPNRQAALLITVPDNPTGTVAAVELLQAACEIARERGWWVISDEVYRDLTYDPESFKSPAELYPERTIITSGLSKNLALGGWRIGFGLFPGTEEGRRLASLVGAIASEVWSAMAAPMQEVATFALNEPPDLRAYVNAARRLHRTVTQALHQRLTECGVRARTPSGAFYLYPDFGAHASVLGAAGITSSEELARRLLESHNVAVLPGSAFGDEPGRLTVRVASSLLYGRTEEERWSALQSEEPARLPWIADALDRVGAAVEEMTRAS